MSHLTVYEKGDVARFETVFKDDEGRILEPDVKNGEHDVSILIKRLATDETIVSDTQMEEISDTQFRYDWQTTQGTVQGEYSVEITAAFSGDDNVNRDRFKVVDILDPNIGQ